MACKLRCIRLLTRPPNRPDESQMNYGHSPQRDRMHPLLPGKQTMGSVRRASSTLTRMADGIGPHVRRYL